MNDQDLSRGDRRAAAAAGEAERERILSIQAMVKRHGVPQKTADGWIDAGTSIEDVRTHVLDQMNRRGAQEPVGGGATFSEGLSDREVGQFSFVRAILAQITGDWSKAGLERAASNAAYKRLGRECDGTGFMIPSDIQLRGNWSKRAPYAVGAAGTGGALVETELLASNFIQVLRNSTKVLQAGATLLSGLVGNVNLPRQITQTQTYWVGESVAVTEAEATVNTVSLTPHTVGAYSIMSRLTLLQTTPDIEVMVRNDFANVMAIAIDLGALSGSGAGGQPTGISNMAGIGSVVGGTNGAQLTIDHLIALEAALGIANVPFNTLGYITNLKAVATLKNLKATTGQYLWTDVGVPFGQREGTPSTINGWPIYRSNQARYNLTKGTSSGICSEVFFANWAELCVGEWGALEVLANPYDATGFPKGDVTIRALQTIDIQPRHTASFAYMADALTAPF